MGTIANRYELEREIGRGAAGSVWIANDVQLCRRVAIKLLRSDHLDCADICMRFEQEARHIAALRSPHVVQVHDAGNDGGQPFIVMELLSGESLDVRLRRNRRLPATIAAHIIGQVAKGISAIHDAGIVHRDLKPSNIFLAREGGAEVVKLLDFGVARALAASPDGPPPSSTIVGTPLYMSPEQVAGAPTDGRSDLWSLGVLAYEMLTGQRPFSSEHAYTLREQIRSGSFVAASSVLPLLGNAWDAFFQRALRPAPTDRFQSASELVAEFSKLAQREGERVTRLLFLDDEPDMEMLLRSRFREELRSGRYELHFASNGIGGLEELTRRPDIDVVFTDLNMPGMDGLKFLERVPEVNPLVRVVVVSAYDDITNIRLAMNRGAFDFLVKPIDFADLQRTIDKCASHAAILREALESHQENTVLRSLVGNHISDRVLTSLRFDASVRADTLHGTVAFIGVYRFSEAASGSSPDLILRHLNAYFEAVVREVLAAEGTVGRMVGDTVVAVFSGHEHACRALDACLAIRDRLRALAGDSDGVGPHCAAMGIDTGTLTAASVGSPALGRLERTLLGVPMTRAAELRAAAGRHEILISSEMELLLGGTHVCERGMELSTQAGPMSSYSVHGRATQGLLRDVGFETATESNLPRTLSGHGP